MKKLIILITLAAFLFSVGGGKEVLVTHHSSPVHEMTPMKDDHPEPLPNG